MQRVQQNAYKSEGLVCCGRAHVANVCTEKECMANPFMCGYRECVCQNPHRRHQKLDIDGCRQSLKESSPVSDSVIQATNSFNSLVDSAISRFTFLKKYCNDKFTSLFDSAKHAKQRQILLSGASPQNDEFSGNIMFQMFQALKSKSSSEVFELSLQELKAAEEKIRAKVESLVQEIGQYWRLKPKPKPTAPTGTPMASSKTQSATVSKSSSTVSTQAEKPATNPTNAPSTSKNAPTGRIQFCEPEGYQPTNIQFIECDRCRNMYPYKNIKHGACGHYFCPNCGYAKSSTLKVCPVCNRKI